MFASSSLGVGGSSNATVAMETSSLLSGTVIAVEVFLAVVVVLLLVDVGAELREICTDPFQKEDLGPWKVIPALRIW